MLAFTACPVPISPDRPVDRSNPRLARLQIESDILKRDEALTYLTARVIEIMKIGGAGIHAGLRGRDSLLGNFVFQLCDLVGCLQLCHGTLQTKGFLGYLILRRFGLLRGLERVGIGRLSAGTLRRVEEREANTHANGRVVLLKTIRDTQKFAKRGHAGARRNVVILKVVEFRQQGILRGEIDAGPERAMLCLRSQILRPGMLD